MITLYLCFKQKVNLVICVCLHYVVYRRPYNLYCVGADVKPCSVNQHYVVYRALNFKAKINSNVCRDDL